MTALVRQPRALKRLCHWNHTLDHGRAFLVRSRALTIIDFKVACMESEVFKLVKIIKLLAAECGIEQRSSVICFPLSPLFDRVIFCLLSAYPPLSTSSKINAYGPSNPSNCPIYIEAVNCLNKLMNMSRVTN